MYGNGDRFGSDDSRIDDRLGNNLHNTRLYATGNMNGRLPLAIGDFRGWEYELAAVRT